MPDDGSHSPRWAARLGALLAELSAVPDGPERDAIRGEIWLILNTSLARYAASGGATRFSPEDLEDLAAEKSLELLSRAESGVWRVEGRAAGEIAAFLATVARHGVVDWSRRQARWVRPEEGTEMDEMETRPHHPQGAASPAARVEGRDFAQALRACAEELQPRARRAWFFRVFYEMPTREIAAHPEVALKPGHVDVLLQRCRDSIRDCMRTKGYEPNEIPPGAFAELWRYFEVAPRTAEVDG